MPDTISPIKRAKARLFGTATEEIPVTFEVKCGCGKTISGTRRTTWQQATCDSCFATHYVLPVNVYPATPNVASEVIGGSFLHRLTVVGRELIAGSPSSQHSAPTAKQKPRRESPQKTTDADSVPQPARRWNWPRLRFPKVDIAGIARRTFTPFRLLMLSMVTVMCVTGGWMWHRHALESARHTWRQNLDEIPAALEQGDLRTLETLLADAVTAGNTLGRQDAEWRATLNLYQETQAVNQLTTADLLNALLDAYTESQNLKPDALQSVIAEVGGEVFVFDSLIEPVTSATGIYAVDMPLAIGGHEIEVLLPLPAMEELVQQPSGRQCLFTARIISVLSPDETSGQQWVIGLEPQSFTLLTSPELCKEFGLPVDDESPLATILQQQKEFIEQSPTWADRQDTIMKEDQ
jgi:hypothetical protein